MPFDDIKRSRLKLTIMVNIMLVILSIFPMYIILEAAKAHYYELASVWAAWSGCIVAASTVSGYYLNKETRRPSFINNNISSLGNVGNIIAGLMDEDNTDPEEIPL